MSFFQSELLPTQSDESQIFVFFSNNVNSFNPGVLFMGHRQTA